MLGNAFEWTISDMMAWPNSSRASAVVCGGSMSAITTKDPSKTLVISYLNPSDNKIHLPFVGFRCVKDVPPVTPGAVATR
jgi:formylglycine-generating enzyme required for sulfatase activity